MAFWDDWLSAVKGIPGAILGSTPASVVQQAAPSFIPPQVVGGKVITNQVIAGAKATQAAAMKKAGIQSVAEAAATASAVAKPAVDPVLWVGNKFDAYFWDPAVARPLSTINLLSDTSSPLYENGFQWSDVKDAYNRSADVTLGQSLVKNKFSLLGRAEAALLEANGVDVSGMNLWDDRDIQKNFVDNTLGKWVTGLNDFVIDNVAMAAVTGGTGALAKSGLKAAGLTTKIAVTDIEALPKYEKDIFDHIDFVEGKGGAQSVIGQDVVDLAASDNIIDITRIVKKHSYNNDLPSLIKDTKDPRIVADFLLADKGYGPAIERLVKINRSDDLWVIGDGTATFTGNYITSGELPRYTAEQRARWSKAFDDAIAKDPKHQEIYDAFLSQELDATTGQLDTVVNGYGKLYRPIEPKGLQGPAGKIRSTTGKLKTAALERDFTNPELSGVVQSVLGGGLKYPTTVLLRKVGTFMPKGIVTHSGLRPFDGIEELRAVFDDVPLFRDGTRVITTEDLSQMTVSEYRQKIISEFADAKTDGERALVVENANKSIAQTIAHSRGYFEKDIVATMVDDLMKDVKSVHGQLRTDGYAMDPTGTRLVVDPVTQRQLANSTPMLPFGDLDRMILKNARSEKNMVLGAVTNTEQILASSAKNIFEASNRLFSVAQLYRFSYIPKNSVFEPLLAATLAEGSNFAVPMFTKASMSVIKKTSNVLLRNIERSKTILPSAKKEIQKEIKALSKQYNLAIIKRDQVYSTYEGLLTSSPATRRDWADQIRLSLKAAEKDVAAIEGKLNVHTIEYGERFNVPSVYSLKARIETLRAANSVRYASEIRSAEMTLQKAVGEINTLYPELNVIDQEIAAAYDEIGRVLTELGPKNVERANLFSVAENRYAKTPYLSDTMKVQLSNGQTLEFPAFSSRKGLGEAYMSEIVSNNTRTLEFLGSKATTAKIETVFAKSPKNTTYVADPTYFDELAYVVNNHMRGDVLVDRILAGQSRTQIIDDWAKSAQARWYLKQRGLSGEDVIKVIDEEISYVNRYLPTEEARLAALESSVKPEQLRGLLGDKLDKMVPIQPLDIQYANPSSGVKTIVNTMDTLLDSSYRAMMKPENMIRQVWADTRHQSIVRDRANALYAAGQEIDLATLNRIHHAAAKQLVDEVAKVFYTIPRQHRALYMARSLATFPNAAASGIYRYGRFAVKNTKRTLKFAANYNSYYKSFGVDEYGNKVDNPMDARYLLIPGTKELGLNNGKGVIINARGTNYVANFPGASWIVPIALSAILGGKPGNDQTIKSEIDATIGKIPGYSYDELFPYGINLNTKSQIWNTFTPAWARNVAMAYRAEQTDKMFVDSWVSESNAQWIRYEMELDKNPNYKGPAPTPKSIMDATKDIYKRKARTQFWSILGTPQVVATKSDKLYQDYYWNAYNEFKAKGQTDEQALKSAEARFQQYMFKTTGAHFPMDRLFVEAQSSVTYITPSQKSYDRIWNDFPGLATSLRQVDPSVVGLMVADLPKDYSPQVNQFLNSTTARLPDGTPVNTSLKTPQLVEEEIEKSRWWKAYSDYKKQLNDAATDPKNGGYASYLSVPALRQALSDYAVQLGKTSKVWYDEYSKGQTKGNAGYIQSQGLKTIVNDEKFMDKYGKTQFWQDAKTFVQYRNQYAKAYADAPAGSKSVVSEAWQAYLASSLDYWDPTLQKMINRYFENDNLKENR